MDKTFVDVYVETYTEQRLDLHFECVFSLDSMNTIDYVNIHMRNIAAFVPIALYIILL